MPTVKSCSLCLAALDCYRRISILWAQLRGRGMREFIFIGSCGLSCRLPRPSTWFQELIEEMSSFQIRKS